VRFSVVTNSFNQVAYLESCLRSVLEQDHDAVEYIVVDAGSTDGSRELIERYSDRIAKVILLDDHGPAAALNHGFRAASGEWIGYLNSDDVYLPGALSRVAAFIAGNPQADVVYGDGLVIDRNGVAGRRLRSMRWDVRGFTFGVFSAVQPATFIRRDLFMRSSGFNPDNRSCWDRELLLDLSRVGAHYAYLPEPLAGFRIHEDSITGSGRLEALRVQDHGRLITKVFGRAPRPTDSLHRVYYRARRRTQQPIILVEDVGRVANAVTRLARRMVATIS
jgi:glycosyltransferase involved in cell wall biosynthesis